MEGEVDFVGVLPLASYEVAQKCTDHCRDPPVSFPVSLAIRPHYGGPCRPIRQPLVGR